MTTPLTIRIYDANDEYVEHNRLFLPWGILKTAVRLSKQLYGKDESELSEEDIDAISAVVVEAFGNKFSLSDMDKGCDINEVLAVFNNIVSRAQSARPNGLPPA